MLAPLTFSPASPTRTELFDRAKKFARDVANLRRWGGYPAGYRSIHWDSAVMLRLTMLDLASA